MLLSLPDDVCRLNLPMKSIKFILSLLLFAGIFSSCEKRVIIPEDTFEVKIRDAQNQKFEVKEALMNKGLTLITAGKNTSGDVLQVKISVNADKEGVYKQTFDYKTGVAISQCMLDYEETDSLNHEFYFSKSYEGYVNIARIDPERRQMSGDYSFVLKPLTKKTGSFIVKGSFEKVNFK